MWRDWNSAGKRWLKRGVVVGAMLSGVAQAGFVNGEFENGTTGWTVTPYYNNGVTSLNATPPKTPITFADLGLAAGGTSHFSTVTGYLNNYAPGPDTSTTPPADQIKLPFAGAASGHLNGDATRRATGGDTTAVEQTITVTSGDIDPSDGKLHVRMSFAPVLEDPNHAVDAQPYFYIELVNKTTGQSIYNTFNYSNQLGVNWKSIGDLKYTDWQSLDISVDSSLAKVGDQITLRFVSASCSWGGHSGELYVDGVSTSLAGLAIAATGPATARAGDPITYTYTYGNGASAPAQNAQVTIVSPQVRQIGTTTNLSLPYASYIAPAGVTCTTPAAGTPGTLVCNVGTLPANYQGGSFTVTWTIPANAETAPPNNVVGHGTYSIAATGQPSVNGGLVTTNLLAATAAAADLAVTVTDGLNTVAPGGAATYTIVVTNNGPSAVSNAPLTQLAQNVTLGNWTCAGAAGACSATTGSGTISGLQATLAAGESITITQSATAGASGATSTTVSVAPPAGVPDSVPTNNTASDTTPIGAVALHTLTVSKTGTGTGTVSSAPAGIACGASCAAQLASGDAMTLTAVPDAGSTFTGWSGACTGMGACNLTMGSQDMAVVATFTLNVTPPTSTVQPVPALGLFGMLGLAMSLVVGGGVALRRRH